jgi:hypothetical protein
MKQIISIILALSLLLALAGCGAGEDYAVARAVYPKLTSYAEEFDTVSQYEQSGMISWEKMEKAYEDLHVAMAAYNEDLQAMRAEAADKLPNVTEFTAETVAQLFAERGENTVYSPVNLYLALAMLSEATSGDTRKEVLDLVGTDDPRAAARLHPAPDNPQAAGRRNGSTGTETAIHSERCSGKGAGFPRHGAGFGRL